MGCNCRKPAQARVTIGIPKPPVKIQQGLGFQQPLPAPNPDDGTLTADRRRIEMLQREAVRRSLGIG